MDFNVISREKISEVSVIVPVYKVEAYLHRCVDSILRQTYQNFELILVDDGSPDNCGVICDEYAKKDSRIHVIHQENGGLSAARNSGIDWVFENSESKWLTFIDSDDWIHKEYLERLLTSAKNHNSEIAMCNWCDMSAYGADEEVNNPVCVCLDAEEALVKYDWLCMNACCKLFRRKLFSDIRFPVGKLHEDAFVTHKIICSAKRTTLCNVVLYYYFHNPESITKAAWTPRRMDEIEAHVARLSYFREHGFHRAYRHQLCACVHVMKYHLEYLLRLRQTQPSHMEYFWIIQNKLRELWLEAKREFQIDRDYLWISALASPWKKLPIKLYDLHKANEEKKEKKQEKRIAARKNDKKTIMLIPQLTLPIPAVGGGAIEQLITHLLDENEKDNLVRLIVVSKYDEEASKKEYKHSRIYYVDPEKYLHKSIPGLKLKWIVYQIWLKLFRNHLITRFVPEKYPRMNKHAFLCYHIALKENVNAISLEEPLEEERFAWLNSVVGENNLYKHLHYVQHENTELRRLVKNSIAISEYVKMQWVKRNDIVGKNVILRNCADTYKFNIRMDNQKRKALRESLGVSEEESLVLYCGRIIPEKGIRQLLECMELLQGQPIKLLLIGGAAFKNGIPSAFSVEMKEKASILPSVIQLGYVSNNELPKWCALSDMQVVPTICQEGAGLVAIEGMAAGLPLITTISGGMVEYVNDDTAVQLPIDKELPHSLANAIMQLHNDPEKRKHMHYAGIQRAKQFDPQTYYHDFVGIFEN